MRFRQACRCAVPHIPRTSPRAGRAGAVAKPENHLRAVPLWGHAQDAQQHLVATTAFSRRQTMITRTLAAGLLATACFCAPAFAQDNTTANPPAATQPMTPGGDNNAT